MNNSLLHIIKNLNNKQKFYNKYSFILNLIHVEKNQYERQIKSVCAKCLLLLIPSLSLLAKMQFDVYNTCIIR